MFKPFLFFTPQDLKEKKEVTEEVEVEKENGSGDAPANGNGTVSNVGGRLPRRPSLAFVSFVVDVQVFEVSPPPP